MVAARTIAVKTIAAMKNARLMIADVKMNVAMTNNAAIGAVTVTSSNQERDWAAVAERCTICR